MYNNNFVVSILSDGRPVKEIGGRVCLPFNTEYSIRLKNKHDRRAVAYVHIDGINATALGGLIIPSRGSVNLERFLDHSLSEGRRFKFVSLDHPEVDDPYGGQNGIVEVKFYLEQVIKLWVKNSIELDSSIKPLDSDISCKCESKSHTIVPFHNFTYFTAFPVKSCSRNLEGATVGGSNSSQSFIRGGSFQTEAMSTNIKIKIYSSADQNEPRNIGTYNPKYCTRCGRRKRYGDTFCASCGKKY
jgi:hypothetical protein